MCLWQTSLTKPCSDDWNLSLIFAVFFCVTHELPIICLHRSVTHMHVREETTSFSRRPLEIAFLHSSANHPVTTRLLYAFPMRAISPFCWTNLVWDQQGSQGWIFDSFHACYHKKKSKQCRNCKSATYFTMKFFWLQEMLNCLQWDLNAS